MLLLPNVIHTDKTQVAAWLSSNAVAHINTVILHRARLILGWVTVSGFNSQCRTFISVCDQPPRSTQPGHPLVGRCNGNQPKDGDALRLKIKGRYGSCVGGR